MLKKKRAKKKRLPSKKQWSQFFKVLNRKERTAFFVFFLIFLFSATALAAHFYFSNTKEMPGRGGEYREGVVGQPRFMNPLYLSSQDADRDIVEVLFSGLMKYNTKGELVNDLIKKMEVKEGGKIFEIYLKENALWHDGTPLTAEDIVFTVNLVQEPQVQSPLRIKWVGIVAEEMSSTAVRFRLPKEYAGFLENLTLKIIPKHIFSKIPPKELVWELISQRYLTGSGPLELEKLEQDKAGNIKKITLKRNNRYYDKVPYLNKLAFVFYKDTESLLKGAKMGEIDGFSLSDPQYFKGLENGFKAYALQLPRYSAIFFNLELKNIFSDKAIREALALSVNKEEILEEVFLEKGLVVDSPILPDFFGFSPPEETHSFNKKEAEAILEEASFKINPQTNKREKIIPQSTFTFSKNLVYGNQGEDVRKLQECLSEDPEVYPEGTVSGYFGSKTRAAVIRFQEKYADDILKPIGLTKGTGDVKPMTRDKLNEICFKAPDQKIPLEINLTTSDKFPLTEIAEVLKGNWEDIGAEVIVKNLASADLETEALTSRSFELLLFGEALGAIPDPFPFWHSSQKEYPGLNIASYQSKAADKLLEKARETNNTEDKQKNLEEFQDVLLEDLPAIFLVQPSYIYLVSGKIKGFTIEKITEPSKRFSTIEKWYIETKRVWD